MNKTQVIILSTPGVDDVYILSNQSEKSMSVTPHKEVLRRKCSDGIKRNKIMYRVEKGAEKYSTYPENK